MDRSFPIVGIGASAGGIDAFRQFFEAMPDRSGMAFVIILHLPAARRSMLVEILDRWTPMRVVEGRHGMALEPDVVYVPPPHSLVTLAEAALAVETPRPGDERMFRPIDTFFDALGSALQERSVGIVLSGTGSDGALGLQAMKARGGLTIAQGRDDGSPEYGEMPMGAIATGAVDLVAPVAEIPGHLMRLRQSRRLGADPPETPPEGEQVDAMRLAICEVLKTHVGHDFSGYRDKTFLRRVRRRMQIVDIATLDDYLRRLRDDHGEVVALFRDLLISVTSFFRDAAAFDAVASQVVPRLFDGKGADHTVRVWVPGCATGEETYSIAMLLREHMDQLAWSPKIQVFATDIDAAAIATARLGRYPETLLDGLSEARRTRFFRRSQGGYVVSKEIREMCTFSTHNLLQDPPFSRMDLVSCRNLLIYLDARQQAAVIPVFHYSLVRGGILLLGISESVAKHGDLFEPLDRSARIFLRRDVPVAADIDAQLRRLDPAALELARIPPSVPRRVAPAPAPAIADPVAAANMRSLARTEERSPLPELFGTLWPALRSDTQRLFRSLRPGRGSLQVLQKRQADIEQQLRALAEQHQTALEELRSANEELRSVNEELQSSNEELETSKEELQSVNEELHTVNSRLSDKVDELDSANSDLRNLFESTEIATLFLDRNLVIRSFTPAIAALYNLIPGDKGRPLTDIVSRLRYGGLREDVATVLETLRPVERRVSRDDRSNHFIMRILPYREPDNRVSGVLVTFVDVSSIVEAEESLREADVRKDVFLATLSHELRNPLAPIRTAARLLEAPEVPAAQIERLRSIIARQVRHMSALLDDLLDISRITHGSFVLRKEPVDVGALLDAAVEAAQQTIEAHHHRLEVVHPEPSATVDADPVRLIQVVTNLLVNAAKFTPDGGLVTVDCRVEPSSVAICVRDTGIGIEPSMLGQVFRMFSRVESEAGHAAGGLGIGLALAKGLVELHGGRIEARSEGTGRGSEFVITMPRSAASVPSAADGAGGPLADTPSARRRVLVADDNPDAAETLGAFLELAGHDVRIAHDGQEAIRLAAVYCPEVCVLDIGMPGATGYDVAKRIREEGWGSHAILIALTGWGQDRDKSLARAAGFDHHLTKPVDPDQLTRLISGSPPASGNPRELPYNHRVQPD